MSGDETPHTSRILRRRSILEVDLRVPDTEESEFVNVRRRQGRQTRLIMLASDEDTESGNGRNETGEAGTRDRTRNQESSRATLTKRKTYSRGTYPNPKEPD